MPIAERTNPIRLLLVCAQCLTTTSLTLLFQRHETVQVVGNAATLAEALTVTQAHRVDVVVVVPERCDTVDLPLVRRLRTHLPGLPLVTLTTHLDLATRTRLLATGAQAHLTTAISEAELVTVITSVARGDCQQYVDTSLLKASLPSPSSTPAPGMIETLTQREREVVQLLLHELTPAEIAARLHVECQSVRNYTGKIYAKLGVRSRSELILRLTQPVLPVSVLGNQ